MQVNQQLNFLQEKIQEIGSAIFFNLSDSVLKLPTSIVTSLKVDDYGFVWFYIQKPKQNLREFDSEFPVRLDFFKKGKNCFLQVMGKAWVVTDPEEMNTLGELLQEAKDIDLSQMVLVKVKMLKADYHETPAASRKAWWSGAVNTVFTLFGSSNSYRPSTYYLAS